MKIYISLPISGREEKARDRAQIIAKKIKEAGHTPVNPFDIYAGENPGYFDHLCADLRVLMDCDAVYFDEDWESSCGCNIEICTTSYLALFGIKNFEVFKGEKGLRRIMEYEDYVSKENQNKRWSSLDDESKYFLKEIVYPQCDDQESFETFFGEHNLKQ